MNKTLFVDVVKTLDYFFEDPSACLNALLSLVDKISKCAFWTQFHLNMKNVDETFWFVLNFTSQTLHRFTTKLRWMKTVIVIGYGKWFGFCEDLWFLSLSCSNELNELSQVAIINECVIWWMLYWERFFVGSNFILEFYQKFNFDFFDPASEISNNVLIVQHG